MGYSLFVTGLTHCDAKRAFPGLTLFTTMTSDAITLIDLEGREVHRWTPPPDMKAFYARGTDDGTLIAHFVDGTEQGGPAGGRAATILELDWDGNVVWQYHNPTLHHDHFRRPDGSTLFVSGDLLDQETSNFVAQGDTGLESGQILSEALIEVEGDGEIGWRWRAHEHLDPADYKFRRDGNQWLHANAVFGLPDGNAMVSLNTLSELLIIDRSSGDVAWRLKAGTTGSQHNPTMLENGNILLFDNGSRRNYSRVLEIRPSDHEVVWEFVGNPRDSFYSQNISGAQRLPNGNTLICEGRSARFFEVTADKEIVWEYISPYETLHMGQRSRAVFRAHRYASDSGFIRGRA